MARSVVYSMSMSLDGYIVGPDGNFNWAEPDEDVFRFATDEVRALDVHLQGRRLYESMLYWEPANLGAPPDDGSGSGTRPDNTADAGASVPLPAP